MDWRGGGALTSSSTRLIKIRAERARGRAASQAGGYQRANDAAEETNGLRLLRFDMIMLHSINVRHHHHLRSYSSSSKPCLPYRPSTT